jgi:hypothetical protein
VGVALDVGRLVVADRLAQARGDHPWRSVVVQRRGALSESISRWRGVRSPLAAWAAWRSASEEANVKRSSSRLSAK